jgi:hypothetical protein
MTLRLTGSDLKGSIHQNSFFGRLQKLTIKLVGGGLYD